MHPLLIAGLALIAGWLAFVLCLVVAKRGPPTRDAVRLVPDALRLVRRLATDRSISRVARLPVWLLLGYLLSPIDFVPDLIPVIGYADDVILIAVVLRGLARRAGTDKIDQHWPGTPQSLATFRALLRLT